MSLLKKNKARLDTHDTVMGVGNPGGNVVIACRFPGTLVAGVNAEWGAAFRYHPNIPNGSRLRVTGIRMTLSAVLGAVNRTMTAALLRNNGAVTSATAVISDAATIEAQNTVAFEQEFIATDDFGVTLTAGGADAANIPVHTTTVYLIGKLT